MYAKSVVMVFLVALSLMPINVAASGGHDHDSHGDDHSTPMQHENSMHKSEGHHDGHDMHGEHDGMSADGSMTIVGSMVSKGVKGMAHIKDVTATMAAMGMKTTHHFMVAFIDEESGDQIEKGTVALKITNPDAKNLEPIELVGMDGHFGADVTLDMKGEYHFKLGTKLEDGTKRKYHFHHVIK